VCGRYEVQKIYAKGQETSMKCAICKSGITAPGHAVVTLHKNGTIIIIKDVPAEVCDNCGEHYLSDQVASNVHAQAGPSVLRKVEVEVLHYAA
jgi:YgiT-type zinc finger domain-containing protein